LLDGSEGGQCHHDKEDASFCQPDAGRECLCSGAELGLGPCVRLVAKAFRESIHVQFRDALQSILPRLQDGRHVCRLTRLTFSPEPRPHILKALAVGWTRNIDYVTASKALPTHHDLLEGPVRSEDEEIEIEQCRRYFVWRPSAVGGVWLLVIERRL